MTAFQQVALQDAFWFQEGPGLRNWQFTTSGIKVLNVGNITPEGSIDLSKTDRHISEREFKEKYSHFSVDAGDLVIASSGISFDADGFLKTKAAFVSAEHLPLCMNTSTIRFKNKAGVSSLNYLRHWFQSPSFRVQVSRLVTGSAQLNFGPSHLKQMTIKLPPLEEQKRIAAVLDQADALRRLRAQTLDRLNVLGRAIFHEMFGGLDEKSPLVTLGSVARKITDGTHQSPEWAESGVPFIFVSNVRNQKISLATKKFVTDGEFQNLLKRTDLAVGDVLYTTVGSYGNAAVVRDKAPFVFQRHIAHIKPDPDKVDPFFLSYALEANELRRQADQAATGVAQKTVSLSAIKKFTFRLPTLSAQKSLRDVIGALESQIEQARRSQHQIDALFNALQLRAF